MDSSEAQDIQGLVFSGYPRHSASLYLLLSIDNPAAARSWLSDFAKSLRTGKEPRQGPEFEKVEPYLNLAFTAHGFQKLGAGGQFLSQFSREFQEGMVTPHRQRILGDSDESDPLRWTWGGPTGDPVDLLVLLFAKDDPALQEKAQALLGGMRQHGLKLIAAIPSTAWMTSNRKEHFGFHDGISQPSLRDRSDSASNSVRTGEFILGYPNEYGVLPNSPRVPKEQDPRGLLAIHHPSAMHDFGRNGTYLVFRQLSQDVRRFWEFMTQHVQGMPYGPIDEARVRLASQCVGRWPSGAPLVLSPEKDNPLLKDVKNFSYSKDQHGIACPLGSHIRRTNPRDSLPPKASQSIQEVKRHRILRRGRAYGKPLDPSMDPAKMLEAASDSEERGLCFICLNADISRQFEFIQQTWINNPKFAELYNDADPLMGEHDPPGQGEFTIQKETVADRVTGLSRFVHVKGGAYFFMPGRKAVEWMANGSLPRDPSPVASVSGERLI